MGKGGGGRGEKVSPFFAFIFPLFPQKRPILRLNFPIRRLPRLPCRQTHERMDKYLDRLDRSTLNNAFSFSHYYTTHFTGHRTIKVNPLFSLFVQSISIRSIWDAS